MAFAEDVVCLGNHVNQRTKVSGLGVYWLYRTGERSRYGQLQKLGDTHVWYSEQLESEVFGKWLKE